MTQNRVPMQALWQISDRLLHLNQVLTQTPQFPWLLEPFNELTTDPVIQLAQGLHFSLRQFQEVYSEPVPTPAASPRTSTPKNQLKQNIATSPFPNLSYSLSSSFIPQVPDSEPPQIQASTRSGSSSASGIHTSRMNGGTNQPAIASFPIQSCLEADPLAIAQMMQVMRNLNLLTPGNQVERSPSPIPSPNSSTRLPLSPLVSLNLSDQLQQRSARAITQHQSQQDQQDHSGILLPEDNRRNGLPSQLNSPEEQPVAIASTQSASSRSSSGLRLADSSRMAAILKANVGDANVGDRSEMSHHPTPQRSTINTQRLEMAGDFSTPNPEQRKMQSATDDSLLQFNQPLSEPMDLDAVMDALEDRLAFDYIRTYGRQPGEPL